MTNAYWNNNGAEQAKYDEMINAGFTFTKKSEAVFYSYYRYFNDGDIPGWARGKYKFLAPEYFGGRYMCVLNDSGLRELEARATMAVLHEYKRFKKQSK